MFSSSFVLTSPPLSYHASHLFRKSRGAELFCLLLRAFYPAGVLLCLAVVADADEQEEVARQALKVKNYLLIPAFPFAFAAARLFCARVSLSFAFFLLPLQRVL